ncbi:hypothetical protein V6N13_049414 [Hibiscus sabdariffa]|uniref:Uncharacterized protein n=1 Tax=Hibiscus sabdariffa TaxID=183260 RepID=A0ABR2QXM5_9ROSI
MSSLSIKSIGKKKYRSFNRKRVKMVQKSMRRRFIKLKEEKESIEEGRRRVQEKMEAIEEECGQITKETNEIIRQTAMTQIRLALMFNILGARQDGDIDKAAHLTQLLRLV